MGMAVHVAAAADGVFGGDLFYVVFSHSVSLLGSGTKILLVSENFPTEKLMIIQKKKKKKKMKS